MRYHVENRNLKTTLAVLAGEGKVESVDVEVDPSAPKNGWFRMDVDAERHATIYVPTGVDAGRIFDRAAAAVESGEFDHLASGHALA